MALEAFQYSAATAQVFTDSRTFAEGWMTGIASAITALPAAGHLPSAQTTVAALPWGRPVHRPAAGDAPPVSAFAP